MVARPNRVRLSALAFGDLRKHAGTTGAGKAGPSGVGYWDAGLDTAATLVPVDYCYIRFLIAQMLTESHDLSTSWGPGQATLL